MRTTGATTRMLLLPITERGLIRFGLEQVESDEIR